MDGFAMSIAGKVAGNVASSLVKALGRQLRDATLGTPEEQAIARAVGAGLGAIAEQAQCDNEEDKRHLVEEVFARFFGEPTPARMLARSLTGKPIDPRELQALFEDCGFDPGTLPGIDFDPFRRSLRLLMMRRRTKPYSARCSNSPRRGSKPRYRTRWSRRSGTRATISTISGP
jgi:hypothetical protein